VYLNTWRFASAIIIIGAVFVSSLLVYVTYLYDSDFNPGPFLPNEERFRFIEKLEFTEETANDSIVATIRNAGDLAFNITGGYVQILDGFVERNLTTISQVITVRGNSTEKVSFTLPAETLVRGQYYLVALSTDYLNSQNSTALLKAYRTYEAR
jgi:hypothetical protein